MRVTQAAHPLPTPIIRTVITIFTPSSSSRNFIFSDCVCLLLMSRYRLLPFLNWLVFVVESDCVYWLCLLGAGNYIYVWFTWTWVRVFFPVLQFSPLSIIPPLLHTHSSIYHLRCIMFFSQYFSFPLSVSFHYCSILIHPFPHAV